MAEITIRIPDKFLKPIGGIIIGFCALLAVSQVWSSGFFRSKYRLRMIVNEAVGVGVGAPVRLDGVDVGEVERIGFDKGLGNSDRSIELTVRVDKRYQDHILSDSTASLVTEGLLGNRYVNISSGYQGTALDNNEEIIAIPAKEIKLQDVVNSFSRIADGLK